MCRAEPGDDFVPRTIGWMSPSDRTPVTYRFLFELTRLARAEAFVSDDAQQPLLLRHERFVDAIEDGERLHLPETVLTSAMPQRAGLPPLKMG